ncbi:MAG: hypothetical protein EHM35_02290, partial [Planctomycetaceae bacterium]
MGSQGILSRIVARELGGSDDALRRISKDPPVPPTPERAAKRNVQIARIAYHLSAPHQIVPKLEDLAATKRITPNMLQAGRQYAVAAFCADGPSAGVSAYGNGTASPPYGRMHTSDERLKARQVITEARFAGFGIRDSSGRIVMDEALRYAVEPILLGDDQAWNLG